MINPLSPGPPPLFLEDVGVNKPHIRSTQDHTGGCIMWIDTISRVLPSRCVTPHERTPQGPSLPRSVGSGYPDLFAASTPDANDSLTTRPLSSCTVRGGLSREPSLFLDFLQSPTSVSLLESPTDFSFEGSNKLQHEKIAHEDCLRSPTNSALESPINDSFEGSNKFQSKKIDHEESLHSDLLLAPRQSPVPTQPSSSFKGTKRFRDLPCSELSQSKRQSTRRVPASEQLTPGRSFCRLKQRADLGLVQSPRFINPEDPEV